MCLLVPQLTSFACCARVPAFARHSRRRSSVGEMDHLLGMVGDGYALVAADRKVNHSIIAVKHDEDKILALDESKLLGCVGELGDTKNFTEFIQKNIALYGLRNGSKLSTHATAHYVRGEIAYAIRSSPKMCNMILVGYDEDAGASLYLFDYLGGEFLTPPVLSVTPQDTDQRFEFGQVCTR